MNRKASNRRAARRKGHQVHSREDLPAETLEQEHFSLVKKGHIVPEMFQKAWAVNGQVEVHVLRKDGSELTHVPMSIADAGTRERFYRRTRRDGTQIDDTEASLAYVETKAEPVLSAALQASGPLSLDDKGGLAQFIGVQMVRGPRFFSQRIELLEPLIREAPTDQFKPAAIRAAQGDVDQVRERVIELYASSTQSHLVMLATALKLGMILANMRWELLAFDGPLVAYSDHPVYVWPGTEQYASPTPQQALGPLEAAEVIVPLGPQMLLIANWIDLPDPPPKRAGHATAGQANAFVIGQADRQWMHRPGAEPPVAAGSFTTISGKRDRRYSPRTIATSRRRTFAAAELAKNKRRTHLPEVRALDVRLPLG
jgi:hypothetical protein